MDRSVGIQATLPLFGNVSPNVCDIRKFYSFCKNYIDSSTKDLVTPWKFMFSIGNIPIKFLADWYNSTYMGMVENQVLADIWKHIQEYFRNCKLIWKYNHCLASIHMSLVTS